MRLQLALVGVGVVAVLGGAWLVGVVVFGAALMAVGATGVTVGLWLYDDGQPAREVERSPRERWRRAA